MNCYITGLPTSRNFKGVPVHPDILTVARNIRDKEKNVTLRDILVKKHKEVLAELGKIDGRWRKFLYPMTNLEDKKIISQNKRDIDAGKKLSPISTDTKPSVRLGRESVKDSRQYHQHQHK